MWICYITQKSSPIWLPDILKNTHFLKNIGHLKTVRKTKSIDRVGHQIRDGMTVELNVSGTSLIKATDKVKER